MVGANAGGEAGQADVVAFLGDPATHGGEAVERRKTHGAIVFLAGDRAWKMKRAVRYPYMDFSTLALRRAAVEAEIRLNRRTAPALYLGARPVVRSADGRLRIGGAGEPIEWLVEMGRFADDATLDRIAARGALDPALVEAIADHVAAFHAGAEVRTEGGGAAGIARVIDDCAATFASTAPELPPAETEALVDELRRHLAVHGPLLDRRRRDGQVRLCHGDLHLANVCLLASGPVLFDALEFDPRLATIDVVYDAAFLVMDLIARELPAAAFAFLDRWAERTGEIEGLAPLPLFLALRAAIRAHVAVATARTAGRAEEAGRARGYLALARRLLDRAPARLVAIGGLSGSGKTTIARGLAPALGAPPGAVLLRSDVVRKRLLGRDPLDRPGPAAYAPETTEATYAALRRAAAAALAAGRACVVDAVHARPEERAAIADVAARVGVPFAGLWLDAPADVLVGRVAARLADASDADEAVVRRQLQYDTGSIGWRRVGSEAGIDSVLAAARRALDPEDGPAGA
ncbi:MAG: AAA family ATPase [Alphaproteobacteria bacterium]